MNIDKNSKMTPAKMNTLDSNYNKKNKRILHIWAMNHQTKYQNGRKFTQIN